MDHAVDNDDGVLFSSTGEGGLRSISLMPCPQPTTTSYNNFLSPPVAPKTMMASIKQYVRISLLASSRSIDEAAE